MKSAAKTIVKDPATRANVLQALQGEAFAFVKYMLFARDARAEGHEDVAKLFEQTALEERYEHFYELATLYGLSATFQENLQNAIDGETAEIHQFYPRCETQAREAGEHDAAERFAEIRHDETLHEKHFQKALREVLRASKKHSHASSDLPREETNQVK